MIITPLALSTIIGLAFGGAGGDVTIQDIPVALVNQDEGSAFVNYGQIFVSAFIPSAEGQAAPANELPECEAASTDGESGPNISLTDLTNAVRFDNPAAARAAVDSGEYAAAVIIPPGFSQNISYIPVLHPELEAAAIEVYANPGRPIQAGIIRSIIEGFTNQIATGAITMAATFENVAVTDPTQIQDAIACAFTPAFNTVKIDQQTITGSPAATGTLAILVIVGSSQAMFFALFTAQGAATGIIEERRQGTLQRLIVSPTPRLAIIIGKMLGNIATVVFQLILLAMSLTLVGSILHGGLVFIWGNNVLLILAVILASALAASGVGVLLIGLARTPEQGQTFGSVVNLALAFLGGAFGAQFPQSLAQFSMIYWSTDAFRKLSNYQTDIGLNLVVLLVQGVIIFAIGFWLFNRRLDF
jgi:ABC-type Na+ efflux pump permease subunit